MAIRAFALSLTILYIPIYLLELGYSLNSVFSFYLYFSIIGVLFFPISTRVSSRFGFKHTILLSTPFLIAFFVLLNHLNNEHVNFILLSFFLAASSSLFWIAFHSDFAKVSNPKKRGSQVSKLQAITLIFTILGPIAGAFVLMYLSYQALFIAACILVVLSVIPLFFSSEIHEPYQFKFKTFFDKKNWLNATVFFGEGIRDFAAKVLWPIFIFLTLKSYITLGSISSVTNLIIALMTLWVGNMSDRLNKTSLITVGSLFHSVTLFIRGFFESVVNIFTVTSFGAISFALMNVPYFATFYNKANKNGVVEFILLREVFLRIGYIFILTIMIIFNGNIVLGLVLGGVGSIAYRFLRE
jgi:MFS family permease